METTKFINKEMATMAAQSVFFYLFSKFNHVTLSAAVNTGTIEIIVFPEDDEKVKLPKRYITSYEKEEWVGQRGKDDAFKVNRFYFYF